ncbi:MAG TPA: sigma-70 family RNA polymerase sigma factor [Actinospica sp.]|nr:sigma-70 family RNA polymerase sigma factor [Actinospica sp.]
MSDRDLVAALRAGDRLAAGQVYDIYGTRLYAYCHELLADAKLSADALRDTFIVAVNRISELEEPEEFGAWLYALARAECARVGISDDAPADAAGAARGDRLARLALDCYSMLEPEQRELLDLAFRHRLVDSDLALVIGVDESTVSTRVGRAQADLETALLVVLAARTGDPRCAEAADFGQRFDEIDGTGVPAWLQEASKHVERCSVCGDAVRNRRPLRLFEELPHAFMPPGVRSRVLEALRDPAGAAFAEQIAERAGRFDEAGFPVHGKSGRPTSARKWILPGVGAMAAAACAVALIMMMTTDHPSSAADSKATSSVTTGSVTSAGSASSFSALTASASGSASTSPSSSPSASTSTSSGSNQGNGGGGGQNTTTPTKTRTSPKTSPPHTTPTTPTTPVSSPPTGPTNTGTSSSPTTSPSTSPSSSSPS